MRRGYPRAPRYVFECTRRRAHAHHPLMELEPIMEDLPVLRGGEGRTLHGQLDRVTKADVRIDKPDLQFLSLPEIGISHWTSDHILPCQDRRCARTLRNGCGRTPSLFANPRIGRAWGGSSALAADGEQCVEGRIQLNRNQVACLKDRRWPDSLGRRSGWNPDDFCGLVELNPTSFPANPGGIMGLDHRGTPFTQSSNESNFLHRRPSTRCGAAGPATAWPWKTHNRMSLMKV